MNSPAVSRDPRATDSFSDTFPVNVDPGVVKLNVIPRLAVGLDKGAEDIHKTELRSFITQIEIQDDGAGRVNGFPAVDDDCNRRFLGAEDPDKGGTAIEVKGNIGPPEE